MGRGSGVDQGGAQRSSAKTTLCRVGRDRNRDSDRPGGPAGTAADEGLGGPAGPGHGRRAPSCWAPREDSGASGLSAHGSSPHAPGVRPPSKLTAGARRLGGCWGVPGPQRPAEFPPPRGAGRCTRWQVGCQERWETRGGHMCTHACACV